MLGEDRVSVAFFGDGALNEGLFYETANMAALWKLPVVYVLENNCYGEYTSLRSLDRGQRPGARRGAWASPPSAVDGNDVLAVYEAAAWAVGARARRRRARPSSSATPIAGAAITWATRATPTAIARRPRSKRGCKQCPDPAFPDLACWTTCLRRAAALDAIDAGVQAADRRAVEFAKASAYP